MPADNMKSSIQNTHVYNHSKLYPAKIVGLVVIIFMVIIYGFVIQGSVSRFDKRCLQQTISMLMIESSCSHEIYNPHIQNIDALISDTNTFF